ncbi:hypothetical protein BDF22DRAFT_744388 [Syncephalis plumigaleata]|nr:hypothetical protein BDF22DRAFT_744388 [Syncephalis plumigaleata]
MTNYVGFLTICLVALLNVNPSHGAPYYNSYNSMGGAMNYNNDYSMNGMGNSMYGMGGNSMLGMGNSMFDMGGNGVLDMNMFGGQSPMVGAMGRREQAVRERAESKGEKPNPNELKKAIDQDAKDNRAIMRTQATQTLGIATIQSAANPQKNAAVMNVLSSANSNTQNSKQYIVGIGETSPGNGANNAATIQQQMPNVAQQQQMQNGAHNVVPNNMMMAM